MALLNTALVLVSLLLQLINPMYASKDAESGLVAFKNKTFAPRSESFPGVPKVTGGLIPCGAGFKCWGQGFPTAAARSDLS